MVVPPVTATACEYVPTAAGALLVEIICFFMVNNFSG
jgi:hypothetical protein